MSAPHSKPPPHVQFHGSGRENGRLGRFLASPGFPRPVSPQLKGPQCSHGRIRVAGQWRAAIPNTKPRLAPSFMAAAMKMGLRGGFWLHTSSLAPFPPNSKARLALTGVFGPRDSGTRPSSTQKLGLSPNFKAAAAKISILSTLPRVSPGRASAAIALLPGSSGMLSKRRSSATRESSARAGFAKHRSRARRHREA